MVSFSFYALLPSTSKTRLWCGIEQRGFLTLPDILVYLASITFAITILLLKRNVIVGFILSTKCSRATSYSAYCLNPLLRGYGLTDKASSYLLYRQAYRICTLFLSAKYVCIRLSKIGCLFLNDFSVHLTSLRLSFTSCLTSYTYRQ